MLLEISLQLTHSVSKKTSRRCQTWEEAVKTNSNLSLGTKALRRPRLQRASGGARGESSITTYCPQAPTPPRGHIDLLLGLSFSC